MTAAPATAAVATTVDGLDGDGRIDGARAAQSSSRSTFAVLDATITDAPDGARLTTQPAAVMATLLAGITGSLPHIPTVADGGSRISHPGYAE